MNINLKGYRTFIASSLVAAFGVLATTDWVAFLDNPTILGASIIVAGVIMAVLRADTNTPPLQPDTPKPGDFGYIPEKEEKK